MRALPFMPTFYQTSATPRGRRRREESENPTSSRPPGQSLHRLSKTISKSSDDRAPSRSNRPASPVSVVSPQRVSIDHRTRSRKYSISHTPSTTSLDSQTSVAPSATNGPLDFPSSTSNSHPIIVQSYLVPVQSVADNPTSIVAQSSRPESPIVTAKAVLPSHVAIITPQARPPTPSRLSAEVLQSNASLQPSTEDVTNDVTPTPTPTPAKPPTQKPSKATDAQDQQSIGLHADVSQSDQGGSTPHQQPVGLAETSQGSTPAPLTMSPPLSPTMHYYGGGPIDYGSSMSPTLPQYPYPYPTQMSMMSSPPPFYPNHYYNTPYPRQFEETQPYDVTDQTRAARPGGEDDREQLAQRVSSVLPDIYRLLNDYKETHGNSSALTVRQSENEYHDQLRQVRLELDANKKEYEKVIQSLVGDRRKLEHEVTDMRQQLADLQLTTDECGILKSQVACFEDTRKELTNSLRLSKEELMANETARGKEIETLKAASRSDKEMHSRRVEDINKQYKDRLAAREKEYEEVISEQKNITSKVQLEMASLISRHAAQKNELEACRSFQNDNKLRLEAKSKELNDVLAVHAAEIEGRKAQEATLSRTVNDMKAQEATLSRTVNEMKTHAAKMAEDYDHKQKEWIREAEYLRAEMQARQDELEKERGDHQKLKDVRRGEVTRVAELAGGIISWRAKHAELEREHQNLDRILQGLGHAEPMDKLPGAVTNNNVGGGPPEDSVHRLEATRHRAKGDESVGRKPPVPRIESKSHSRHRSRSTTKTTMAAEIHSDESDTLQGNGRASMISAVDTPHEGSHRGAVSVNSQRSSRHW